MQYSVLMSVYSKENPEYFEAALQSILNQTIKPAEIVLVCDGMLTMDLENVISRHSCELNVVRLEQNMGLGKALNEGLFHCSYEWIARMDTDDIAVPDRCEKQLKYLKNHPEVAALSGTIAEFQGNALTVQMAKSTVTAYKRVPKTQKEISSYIKQRNPINHPCVMFRKSSVEISGGYQPCPYFEDYDLWLRMYRDHAVFANLPDTLLYMRVNGMHQRRGGIRYAKCIVKFRMKMYQNQVITFGEFIPMTVARVMVSLMPNPVRKYLYDKKLRKH